MKNKAAEILAAASKKYLERNAVYGDNYLRVGQALNAMFPDGLVLANEHDHNRFQIFNLIMVKLSRYAVNWNKGGHHDSIHDACVYCAMLESIDEYKKEGKVERTFQGKPFMTSEQLQAEGKRLAAMTNYVSVILPSQVSHFVEFQMPFILSETIPEDGHIGIQGGPGSVSIGEGRERDETEARERRGG